MLLNVLVVEDVEDDFRLIERHMRQHGLDARCQRLATPEALRQALARGGWDVVLSDFNVPGMAFERSLAFIRAHAPDLPIILISGSIGEDQAVELLKQGVSDFVLKDRLARLVPVVVRSVHEIAERRARRTAEQALQQSEERFQLALRGANDGLWDWDLQTDEVYYSPRWKSMLGYAEQELGSHADTWKGLIHRFDREPTLALVRDLLEGRISKFAAEFRMRHKHGHYIDVLSRAFPVSDAAGKPVRLVGTHVDITERKRAEHALHEREAQYRAVIETSADGFLMLDMAERVLEINDAYVARSGYSREELMTMRLAEVEPRPGPADARRESVLRGGSALFETCHRTRDGEFWPAETVVSYWPIAGGRFFLFVRDITRRKAVEAARDAALAEAERLARVRRDFLANMSHEIRTPLKAVLGLARVGAGETDARHARDLFDRILDSGRLLLEMVDDILDFSKIEAGDLELRQEPFVLAEVIDRSIGQIAGRAYAKKLDFIVEESTDLPDSCRGDPLRLVQVLVNLLSNAVKFTEHGQISLRVLRDQGDLLFRVLDSGIGISDEKLATLFQPFDQADGSATRRYGGTGLGLAISSRLVAMMGGRIGATSRLGEGTEVVVRLPLRDPTAAFVPGSPPVGSVVLAGFPEAEADRLRKAFATYGVAVALQEIGLPGSVHPDLLILDGAASCGTALASAMDTAVQGGRVAVACHGESADRLPDWLRQHALLLHRPLRVRHLLSAGRKHPLDRRIAAGREYRLAGLRVLAAEDNEVNRLVLREMLEGEGAHLSLAEDGRLALQYLIEKGPDAFDIVLTDIQLPEMNGYETARRVRALCPELAVIGVTAHAMPEERDRCLAAGMADYVAKPIDIDALVAAILHCARLPAKGLPGAIGPDAEVPSDPEKATEPLPVDEPGVSIGRR